MKKAAKIHLHHGDLPDNLDLGDCVAVDTETMGLKPIRDRLCLIQLSAGDGECHLVKFDAHEDGHHYDAPNLRSLLASPDILKLFHFARFDVAVIAFHLGVMVDHLYCTKIASKLCRTYTDQHGLKALCKELLNIEISKQQQSSDWGAEELSEEQKAYAASDVLYLHQIKDKLDAMLEREHRTEMALDCFSFVPCRVMLDLSGWDGHDIFDHK